MAHGIFSKDDKASLKLIHDILHADDDDDDDDSDDRAKRRVDDDDYDSSEPDIPSTSAPAAASRNERRSSLPSYPSIASLRSEYSITSPPPEVSIFEQKRRRAAKLTNFFGVNHRDIMTDILESIESGVAEERGRGTLNQAQADVRSPRAPLMVESLLILRGYRPILGFAPESVEPQNQDLIILIYFCVYILTSCISSTF